MVTLERTTSNQEETVNDDSDMRRRAAAVRSFRNNYWSLMNRTGFGGMSTTQETIRWLDEMKTTDDASEQKSIIWREDFIQKDGSLILEQGESLYATFMNHMNAAKPYLSEDSYRRWFDRLYDTRAQSSSTSSFKMKLNWVQSELGNYVSRWKKVAQERDAIVKNPQFQYLLASEPDLEILNDREKCLNLHYLQRRGLVSKALALMNANETDRVDIFAIAKGKLMSAAGKEILLRSKVGVWLERIFSSKANGKKIAAFVNGSEPTSLEGLIQNWTGVKRRFDNIEKKFMERWEGSGIRGFQLFSKTQFLSLNYTQRLRYVEQAEDRLDAANDVENEAPILLKLRHAMDTTDWEDATELIGQGKMSNLSEKDFRRLKSMESYVKQFSGGREIKERSLDVTEARKRIDMIVEELGVHHSEIEPMILRLLKSPHANRNIHQFRWIVYNNDWCTTHGYLNYDIARRGASKENEELTRERSAKGEDVGRNDVIGATTAHQQAIRKREYATHKATFHHVDVTNSAANNTTAEWLEQPQDSRDLYWRSYIANDKGTPKSHNWHCDLLANLTELRSLSRTINNAGFIYNGPSHALVGLN